ncbi:hypothetical protein Tco_0077786 [Tanacetum coccineum]
MKRVNTFVAMSSKAQERNEKKVEGSEEKAKSSRKKSLGKKRARKEQQQESPKRQKMEDDKETDEHEEVEANDTDELKKHLMIVKDDEIALDAIPLATKPLVIVEYKLLKERIMVYYQLIRADGCSKRYSSMIRMFQDIDKEDLQILWKLVKTKHGDIRPEDEHERVFWGDLKVMFEPDIRSEIWRKLQGYTVTVWKLYDSYGVHFVRIHHYMRGSYYLIPCSILSIGKYRKTLQQYLDFPTTSWRIFIRSMDSFQGLTPKSPSSWHRPLASSLNFYDHALLEDLALYDNESLNNPRDFANPVKAIALPQDVSMNKITTSCKICSSPHDTQYCMEDPEQAFVEYASSRTDEAGEGLVSNFMASQDARLSKFEADFKQQQSDMTNKIDTVLKPITDRIAGTLPSDTVKNPKLGTHPVSSACSYPTMDPQFSTQITVRSTPS